MKQQDLSEAISLFHKNLKRYDVICKRSEIEIWLNSDYFTLHYESDDAVATQEFSLTSNDDIIPLYFNIEIEWNYMKLKTLSPMDSVCTGYTKATR